MKATAWMLQSGEPWTRYRTLIDLAGRKDCDPDVIDAKNEMLRHPYVRGLIDAGKKWGMEAIKRHNDAGHPLYAITTLADFGLSIRDEGISEIARKLTENQSSEGAFLSPVFIPKAFGGPNEAMWTWLNCDAPTVLFALLSFGCDDTERIKPAVDHLLGVVESNGYRCTAASALGGFRGPGKRLDPCPMANLIALKAFSLLPDLHDEDAVHHAVDMLLSHWDSEPGQKYYLFGVGKKYRRLKYPFVWYDILHTADVLTRFNFVHEDPRFISMLKVIYSNADENGQYTASSMYRAWKGWSFADKRKPSPWLTFLVYRIQKRVSLASKRAH